MHVRKRIIALVFIVMSASLFISAIKPVSAAGTHYKRVATIHIVTDTKIGESQSQGVGYVKDVIEYLSNNAWYISPSETIIYKYDDVGKKWDTSDVSNRDDEDQMGNDLIQDWGHLAYDDDEFVIGFTSGLDQNGAAYRDKNVCWVSYNVDLPTLNWDNKILTLHELTHLLGDLTGGDNGHVDREVYGKTCSMNYLSGGPVPGGDHFGLCSDCLADIKNQAINHWSRIYGFADYAYGSNYFDKKEDDGGTGNTKFYYSTTDKFCEFDVYAKSYWDIYQGKSGWGWIEAKWWVQVSSSGYYKIFSKWRFDGEIDDDSSTGTFTQLKITTRLRSITDTDTWGGDGSYNKQWSNSYQYINHWNSMYLRSGTLYELYIKVYCKASGAFPGSGTDRVDFFSGNIGGDGLRFYNLISVKI